MADLYFNSVTFLDLSVSSNLELFIKSGKPVNLGTTGQTPTGSSPLVFDTGDATTFATNVGGGGGWTLQAGGITTDSNGP